MTREELMEIAWRDFVMWASRQSEIVDEFNKEKGCTFLQGASPFNAMIDEATGKTEADAYAFVEWVSDNLWGNDEAPKKWRERRK